MPISATQKQTRPPTPGRWLEWALVLAAVVAGCLVRAHLGYSVPSYSRATPVGLMKSDPALLYWFTERIADDHGAIPPEFAASRMVQWPETVNLPAEFPMAQPWIAANGWRLWNALGGAAPLHTFCIGFFALWASLAAVGVYGLARELTGRRDLALLALLLWLVTPAAYRTVGFVLLGEDVSFPALALHLWLVARAARMRSRASFLLAGLPLLVSMASWHAAGFFVALEAAAFFFWYLRSGENPFSVSGAGLVLVPLALGCVLEPMLRSKLAILSPPLQLALALLIASRVEARRPLRPAVRAGVAIGAGAALLGLALILSRVSGSGLGDYSHVFGLVAAKLRFLGSKPADPNLLPFDVRILWQGPFETSSAYELFFQLGFGLLGLIAAPVLAARSWRTGRAEQRPGGRDGGRADESPQSHRGQDAGRGASSGDRLTGSSSAEAIFAPLALLSLLASWLIQRTLILAALLGPVALALLAGRVKDRRLAWAGFLLPVGLGAFSLSAFLQSARSNPWHTQAVKTILEVKMVAEKVPAGAAVACDEIGSTAILAHTGHPILAQPKYEWTAARARLREFRMAASRGTPQDLAAFLDAHDCRYVLLDTTVLWGSRYQVGIPATVSDYPRGSALSVIERSPQDLPGFKLLDQLRGSRDPRSPGPVLFLALYERTGGGG